MFLEDPFRSLKDRVKTVVNLGPRFFLIEIYFPKRVCNAKWQPVIIMEVYSYECPIQHYTATEIFPHFTLGLLPMLSWVGTSWVPQSTSHKTFKSVGESD